MIDTGNTIVRENTSMRFRDEVVIVTGAAIGIGATMAGMFAREGARVAALDIDRPRLDEVVRGITAGGAEALALGCDVTSAADVGRAVDAIAGRWGRIDVLVNNAGGFFKLVAMEDIDADEWDAILRLNLTSVFLCSKAVVPIMKRQRGGRIVSMASIAGRSGNVPTAAHYAAAKAGIIGFTRQLAREVAGHGILVNAVAPGTVGTPRVLAARSPEATNALASAMPVGRLGEPADIAEVVLFLASDAARFVTGATLDANGGQAMV
jgi:NAD(P)-dependent dehydrogenase (short-subunit alcohol dehydrogenase family)